MFSSELDSECVFKCEAKWKSSSNLFCFWCTLRHCAYLSVQLEWWNEEAGCLILSVESGHANYSPIFLVPLQIGKLIIFSPQRKKELPFGKAVARFHGLSLLGKLG